MRACNREAILDLGDTGQESFLGNTVFELTSEEWIENKWGCGLPRWLTGKESAYWCRRHSRHKFTSWVGKMLWRRKWQPTLVFLPGRSHKQESVGLESTRVTKSWTRLSSWAHRSSEGEIETEHSRQWEAVCQDCIVGGDYSLFTDLKKGNPWARAASSLVR